MKRIIFAAVLITLFSASYGLAQMGGGMMGQGHMMSGQTQQGGSVTYGGKYYPCRQMMGPGMMGYGGHMGGMMGPGMMGYGGHMGGMMGPGMMGPGMMGYGGYGMMGGHMGGMMGFGTSGKPAYDSEAYEKYMEDYQSYMDETSELRRKLHNKRFEYSEALRNPGTDRDALLKLEKEMRDIQWQIYEKAPR